MSLQTATGSLVMIGLNTPEPQVFWNGKAVDGIIRIKVDNSPDGHRVTLSVADTGVFAELAQAGVSIRVGK